MDRHSAELLVRSVFPPSPATRSSSSVSRSMPLHAWSPSLLAGPGSQCATIMLLSHTAVQLQWELVLVVVSISIYRSVHSIACLFPHTAASSVTVLHGGQVRLPALSPPLNSASFTRRSQHARPVYLLLTMTTGR